jgi:uncharacterized membrane protein SpoIIM required for sporulation
MVLEQIFSPKWIEKRPRHMFFLGVIFSIIGIISARLIFPSSVSMMSVAFTSLLLIPALARLLQDEENVEIREKKLSIKLLLKDHKDIFEIYFFLFMGVFSVYFVTAFFFPTYSVLNMFSSQLKVAGITGYAFNPTFFWGILKNNLVVIVACLALSLVYGAGSILFITWNATVWGAIIGFFAQQASIAGGSPFSAFAFMVLPALPHLVTEAVAYFSAAIAGGVLSKAVLREKLGSKKFHHILTDALLMLALGLALLVIAAIIEAAVAA